MPVRPALAVALALLCVASVAPASGHAPARPHPNAPALAGPDVTATTGPAVFGQTSFDPDDVSIEVSLDADGNATWRVAYRMRLATDNETAAFESLANDVHANPDRYASDFADGMQGTVDSAENATGRRMALRNVTVTAEKQQFPQSYGVVTYTFTWTNFAAVDGSRLRAGDALAGLFLDSETTFIVSWPTDYSLERVAPRPSENRTNAVVWTGPLEFTPDQPSVVLARDTGGATSTDTTTTGGPSTGGGVPPLALAGAVLALLLLAGGAYWYRRSDETPDDAGGGEAAATPDAGDTEHDDATAEASDDASGASDPPAELLSNEEQVIRLLEENGGRMKQQQVVQTLDWTDAKTSQVISGLRDDGDVETFRIGRENVVKLPDGDDSDA